MPDNPNISSLNFDIIGPYQLCEIVKTFESKMSCDLDGISIKLIRHIISEICHPLAHIFNLSTSTDTFPSMLKTSHTVSFFKVGSPLLCDNYRPISILSTLSKLTSSMNTNMFFSISNQHSTILSNLEISKVWWPDATLFHLFFFHTAFIQSFTNIR
jgi:hypothetical protein